MLEAGAAVGAVAERLVGGLPTAAQRYHRAAGEAEQLALRIADLELSLKTTLEYGVGSDIKARRGKPQTYQCRVEGKKLYQTGALATGLTVEEVWALVEK